jgi:hypothetical protein
MKKTAKWVCGLLTLSLMGLGANIGGAQEAKKSEETKKAAPAMPPLPKPGPEHEVLKNDAGVWDATVEMLGPGAPNVSKGVETNTMLGGLWLVTDFKSEMMSQPFQGHGVAGYDPARKKYVGTWVDSMSTGLQISESSYDASKKTMTGWIEGPDMSGKTAKMKAVTEYKDPDTRVFTMYFPGPDGKEAPGMRITYKRRK